MNAMEQGDVKKNPLSLHEGYGQSCAAGGYLRLIVLLWLGSDTLGEARRINVADILKNCKYCSGKRGSKERKIKIKEQAIF